MKISFAVELEVTGSEPIKNKRLFQLSFPAISDWRNGKRVRCQECGHDILKGQGFSRGWLGGFLCAECREEVKE